MDAIIDENKKSWLQRFILWREKKIKEKHFILILSFLAGIFTGKRGNKHDNRASQLEWCTIAENTRRAHALGLYPRNSKKGAST